MKKLLALLISIVLCFSLFTACKVGNGDGNDDGGNEGGGLGSLKMTSFTLVETSVKTSYLLNDTVDFSGIKVNIKYNDKKYNKELGYSDLTLEGVENLTATSGEKTVTFKYNDAVIQGAVRSDSFKVNVYRSATELEEYEATEFTDPVFLTQRKSVISKAGTAQYGNAQYSGQFFAGQDTTYYVGDDNLFKFVPQLTILNADDEEEVLPTFISKVKVSLKVNNAYVELIPTEDASSYAVTYSYNNKVLVTVDTCNNTYQFAKDGSAIDKQFKIEVVPADFYELDSNKVSTIEVKVIDAFNVYTAKELSVIDNMQSNPNGDPEELENAWVDIKTSLGLLNTTVNGVVLHNDINILASDIPEAFFNTAQKTVVYSDGDDTNSVADVTINAGDKVLKDNEFIFERQSAGKFVMQGNYFTVSVANLPLVGSEAVFNDGSELGYGADFSNSALLRFDGIVDAAYTVEHQSNPDPSYMMDVNVYNTQFIGNASRNELRSSHETGDNPLSAGGLILSKTRKGNITFTNVLQNSFFITYLADSIETFNTRNVVTLNYVKCYDSYQNAGFIWNNAEIVVNNSNIENAGGPLFILQHETDLASDVLTGTPELKIDGNTTLISMLNGEEFWFSSVGAKNQVGLIKALDKAVKDATSGAKSYISADNKMNIIAITMASGGIEGLEDIKAEGKVVISDFVMSRDRTDPLWGYLTSTPTSTTDPNALVYAGAPVFGNGLESANDIGIYYMSDDTTVIAPLYAGYTFGSGLGNYVSLRQKGLGAVLGLFNAQ